MKSDTMRMAIGFAVVLVVLLVWQTVFAPKRPKAPPPAQAAPAQVSPAQAGQPAETPAAVAPAAPAPAVPRPAAGAAAAAPLPETTAVLENDLLRIRATSAGGALTSVYLKRHNAELVPTGTSLLGTRVFCGPDTYDLRRVPATVTTGDNHVEFVWTLDSGRVTRAWTLGPDYTLACSLGLPPAFGIDFDCLAGISTTEVNRKDELSNFHFCAREEGKVRQVSVGSLLKKGFAGTPDWAGLKSKYFLLAVINQQGRFQSALAWALTDGRCGFRAFAGPGAAAAGFTVYAGPIEYNRLRSYGIGLDKTVSLGWIKPIAVGILWVLHLFFAVFRNWGVAIIFFSVLMKVVFYPLTRIQTRQMRQMQLLQPKINELKVKYKADPQMLNQETMRLYRVYKINPLSGCLPLLVQMPVFFALYAVLRSFIELRGARFLWLDLSQPDTLLGHIPSGIPLLGGAALGLLPLLMGVSFIGQNLLTSTDKRNWMMTVLFPIFITAIFLNLSSGLQLYWFIYNVLSILESLIATKGGKLWQRIKGSDTESPTPAA